MSTETGRPEIYVQPFPGPGAKTQISVAGGFSPRWPRGGKELFYIGLDSRLMTVTVTEQGSSISSDVPRALLTLREGEEYLPSNDGQRFLVNRVVADPSPITIVLNWKPPGSPEHALTGRRTALESGHPNLASLNCLRTR